MYKRIVIPLILVTVSIVSLVAILGYQADNHLEEYHSPASNIDSLIDESQIILVLNHCERQELGLPQIEPFLEFHNSTHHIDNIDCEWIIDEGLMHSPYGMIPYDDYRQDDNIKTGIYLNNTFIPDVD